MAKTTSKVTVKKAATTKKKTVTKAKTVVKKKTVTKKKNNSQRYLVIIPTYNEKENAKDIAMEALSIDPKIDLLFVDDNSPDKTANIIKRMMKTEKRVNILEREKKEGLGKAYIAGFNYAIEQDYKYVFEMDADFSHKPHYLKDMIAALNKGTDLVVGSRYSVGVSVAFWPLKRLLLSKFANVYASIMTGVPIKDLTAGFVGYKLKVLKTMDLQFVRSSGYSFQIEMKNLAYRWGFKLSEVPIIFTDRIKGTSKISKIIIFEALFRCLTLRFAKKSDSLKKHLLDEKAKKKKKKLKM